MEHDKLKEVLDKHDVVFDGSLGCMKDVTLQVDPKVKPKFLKPRTVPFLLRDRVEKELDRLEQLGIISPVQHSQWVAPTAREMVLSEFVVIKLPPLKLNHSRGWMNLFSDLSGGKYFTKLDLSNA